VKRKKESNFWKRHTECMWCKKIGGTNEGLIQFNALYAEVKADREKNDGVIINQWKLPRK